MSERMIDVRGVELCTESFGDPAEPAVLLIMGAGSSMSPAWDTVVSAILRHTAGAPPA